MFTCTSFQITILFIWPIKYSYYLILTATALRILYEHEYMYVYVTPFDHPQHYDYNSFFRTRFIVKAMYKPVNFFSFLYMYVHCAQPCEWCKANKSQPKPGWMYTFGHFFYYVITLWSVMMYGSTRLRQYFTKICDKSSWDDYFTNEMRWCTRINGVSTSIRHDSLVCKILREIF